MRYTKTEIEGARERLAGLLRTGDTIYTVLRRRRLRLAVSQLPDALLSIATSLRAGMSLPLSLETLVAHQPAPYALPMQE